MTAARSDARSGAAVRKWDFVEIALRGVDSPGAFDLPLQATFSCGKTGKTVAGFYDGGGVYKIRFMPEVEGEWSWKTAGDQAQLARAGLAPTSGSFTCVAPAPGARGPVRVVGEKFRCADGSPFFAMGTTAYAWWYRGEEQRKKTVAACAANGFNKLRTLVFPKQYGDGKLIDISADPPSFPYEGAPKAWNYRRFNPAFFRDLEARVHELRDAGVVADLILFHPYDFGKWELPQGMSDEDDLRLARYLVARFAAFDNVWWSLANEYDLFMKHPSYDYWYAPLKPKDWDAIGETVAAADPYGHPLSIHNWPFVPPYPNRPWMSHVSYQHSNTFSFLLSLRAEYGKPVINEEYQYEGDVPYDYGNLNGEAAMRRHWAATMAGGYATHGEILNRGHGMDDYFWAYGGELVGESPRRLRFMRELLEACPFDRMEVERQKTDGRDIFCLADGCDCYLYFISPEFKDRSRMYIGVGHGEELRYRYEIWDAWACAPTGSGETTTGLRGFELPRWAVLKLTRSGG